MAKTTQANAREPPVAKATQANAQEPPVAKAIQTNVIGPPPETSKVPPPPAPPTSPAPKVKPAPPLLITQNQNEDNDDVMIVEVMDTGLVWNAATKACHRVHPPMVIGGGQASMPELQVDAEATPKAKPKGAPVARIRADSGSPQPPAKAVPVTKAPCIANFPAPRRAVPPVRPLPVRPELPPIVEEVTPDVSRASSADAQEMLSKRQKRIIQMQKMQERLKKNDDDVKAVTEWFATKNRANKDDLDTLNWMMMEEDETPETQGHSSEAVFVAPATEPSALDVIQQIELNSAAAGAADAAAAVND